MPFFVLHLGVCIIIGVSCISKLAQYVPPCKAFGVFILISSKGYSFDGV